MSKKTIAFQIPRPSPRMDLDSRELASAPAQPVIEAEHWVSQVEPLVELPHEVPAPTAAPRAATITLTISAEPDLFEAVRIGLFLPTAAFWLWGLAATRRNFQLFSR